MIVVVGMALAGQAVLMQRRGPDGTYPGLWELPGGKVEEDDAGEPETFVGALAREFKEELGITIGGGCYCCSWSGFTKSRGGPLWTIVHCYDVGAIEGTPEPKVGQPEVRWMAFAELATLDEDAMTPSMQSFATYILSHHWRL